MIATGIEETQASKFSSSFARKPAVGGMNQMPSGMRQTVNANGTTTTRPYTNPVAGGNMAGEAKPSQPLPGLQKPPINLRSKVEEKSLKIPDFLQKK